LKKLGIIISAPYFQFIIFLLIIDPFLVLYGLIMSAQIFFCFSTHLLFAIFVETEPHTSKRESLREEKPNRERGASKSRSISKKKRIRFKKRMSSSRKNKSHTLTQHLSRLYVILNAKTLYHTHGHMCN